MSAMLDTLLDAARLAECERNDARQRAGLRPVPGSASEAYHWPQVLPRDKPATERRTGPRASRFADLTST